MKTFVEMTWNDPDRLILVSLEIGRTYNIFVFQRLKIGICKSMVGSARMQLIPKIALQTMLQTMLLHTNYINTDY